MVMEIIEDGIICKILHMVQQVYVKGHVRRVPLDYWRFVKEIDLLMKWVHLTSQFFFFLFCFAFQLQLPKKRRLRFFSTTFFAVTACYYFYIENLILILM